MLSHLESRWSQARDLWLFGYNNAKHGQHIRAELFLDLNQWEAELVLKGAIAGRDYVRNKKVGVK